MASTFSRNAPTAKRAAPTATSTGLPPLDHAVTHAEDATERRKQASAIWKAPRRPCKGSRRLFGRARRPFKACHRFFGMCPSTFQSWPSTSGMCPSTFQSWPSTDQSDASTSFKTPSTDSASHRPDFLGPLCEIGNATCRWTSFPQWPALQVRAGREHRGRPLRRCETRVRRGASGSPCHCGQRRWTSYVETFAIPDRIRRPWRACGATFRSENGALHDAVIASARRYRWRS
jgi:hypothetical protein